jgi:hypothetical protein
MKLILGGLLLISGAMNAFLLLRQQAPPRVLTPMAVPCPKQEAPASGWVGTDILGVAPLPIAAGRRTDRADAGSKPSVDELVQSLGRVGPEEERHELCEVAQQSIRERWRSERATFTEGILQDLSNPEKRRTHFEKDAAELSDALGLSSGDRDRFIEEYRPLREAHAQAIQDALTRFPTEYGPVASAVKALISDEDRLAVEYGGEEGLLRVRASQLESRTSVLAILTALAGQPWDDNIVW